MSAGLKYLIEKQNKGQKGKEIMYKTFQLQYYLCPFSNLELEDQRLLFNLRSRMNPMKTNFSGYNKMKPEFSMEFFF